MTFIRSTLFNLFFYPWTLLVSIVFLPTLLMPPKITVNAGRFWAKGTVIAARIICGIKWEIRGLENLPKGAVIIASKHQSAWETIVLYLICKMPVYVLKKELTYIPIFGWYFKAIKTIAIDRSAGAKAIKELINQSKDRLEKNRQIIIFPEGTRVKAGETGNYQPGVAAIYNQTDVPVVPLALNSGICWGRNGYTKKPGTIIFEFLPPIKSGLKKGEFMKILEEKIETSSQKLL